MNKAYDDASEVSILNHALKLLDKSIHDLYPEAKPLSGKGGLGECVEWYHFGYKPNSNPEPDFAKIRRDLKCTPLRETRDGLIAKERLVITMIDFVAEAKAKSIEESHFWQKAKMLLMFYLHDYGKEYLDYLFLIIRLWQIPATDLKIIKDDWNKIHQKLLTGKAHELSESDTLYLGACRKGNKDSKPRVQFLKDAPLANPRAYCLKQPYVNCIIADSLLVKGATSKNIRLSEKYIKKLQKLKNSFTKDTDAIVHSIEEYQREETFEELVVRKFSDYYGLTLREISEKSGCLLSFSAKDFTHQICRAILGIKGRKIEEFEKADILLKTVNLGNDLFSLKESMSFKAFKYEDLGREEVWEDSEWYETLQHRFFFVVFQKPVETGLAKEEIRKQSKLIRVFFWGMPNKDVDSCMKVWKDTRDKVRLDIYDNFTKMSDHPICHVRPHAQNNQDTYPSYGNPEVQIPKKCFWLRNKYILRIVQQHIKDLLPVVSDTFDITTVKPTIHPFEESRIADVSKVNYGQQEINFNE